MAFFLCVYSFEWKFMANTYSSLISLKSLKLVHKFEKSSRRRVSSARGKKRQRVEGAFAHVLCFLFWLSVSFVAYNYYVWSWIFSLFPLLSMGWTHWKAFKRHIIFCTVKCFDCSFAAHNWHSQIIDGGILAKTLYNCFCKAIILLGFFFLLSCSMQF